MSLALYPSRVRSSDLLGIATWHFRLAKSIVGNRFGVFYAVRNRGGPTNRDPTGGIMLIRAVSVPSLEVNANKPLFVSS
jgi:hypothetical protein